MTTGMPGCSAQRALATYFPFVEFLNNVAVAIVLGVGASRVHSGAISTGELIAFVLYVDLFFSPVQQLSQTFDSYQQAARSGCKRISDLLRTPTSTPAATHPDPDPRDGRRGRAARPLVPICRHRDRCPVVC